MSNIQFWLSRDVRLRLPVNPASVSVSSPFGYEDIQIASFGEITVIGDRGQAQIEFSSFFPRDYNPAFCEYADFPSPIECVRIIEKLRDNRKPLRLTVTGTNINNIFTIRDFSYEPERAGNPGDIYYSLSLKEYREPSVRKLSSTTDKTTVDNAKRPASTKPAAKKTYMVKKGDSLWKIAARSDIYGNGSKWNTIYNANKALIGNDPDLIHPGQKLVIP